MSHSRSPGCVGCLLAVPLHSIIGSLRTQRPLGPQGARRVWRVFRRSLALHMKDNLYTTEPSEEKREALTASGVAASIWCPGSQSKAGTVRSRKKGISMKSCDWIGCPARWHRPQVFKDDSAGADWWTVRSRAARRSEPGPRGRSSSGRTAKRGRHLNH
ncbi:unnamed protein product [Gadus morhua 'NCC']